MFESKRLFLLIMPLQIRDTSKRYLEIAWHFVCKMLGFPGGVRVHMEAAYVSDGSLPGFAEGPQEFGYS